MGAVAAAFFVPPLPSCAALNPAPELLALEAFVDSVLKVSEALLD